MNTRTMRYALLAGVIALVGVVGALSASAATGTRVSCVEYGDKGQDAYKRGSIFEVIMTAAGVTQQINYISTDVCIDKTRLREHYCYTIQASDPKPYGYVAGNMLVRNVELTCANGCNTNAGVCNPVSTPPTPTNPPEPAVPVTPPVGTTTPTSSEPAVPAETTPPTTTPPTETTPPAGTTTETPSETTTETPVAVVETADPTLKITSDTYEITRGYGRVFYRGTYTMTFIAGNKGNSFPYSRRFFNALLCRVGTNECITWARGNFTVTSKDSGVWLSRSLMPSQSPSYVVPKGQKAEINAFLEFDLSAIPNKTPGQYEIKFIGFRAADQARRNLSDYTLTPTLVSKSISIPLTTSAESQMGAVASPLMRFIELIKSAF